MDSEAPSPLRDIQTADELALRFNSFGFGGRLDPEDAARFQAQCIANASLAEDVPPEVRDNFERARKLHLHGVLEYEFFTAASDYSLLVLEGALRLRFVSHYDHEIPLVGNGGERTLRAENFDEVRDARRYELRGADGPYRLPVSLSALLDWARRERLLPGTRTRIVDKALADLRNHAAHPVSHTTWGPPDSARTLRDVAEMINRLWGHGTPGGRLFALPAARRPRAVALAPDRSEASEMELDRIPMANAEERGWEYSVFLAAGDEPLTGLGKEGLCHTHQPGFQTTVFPCEPLWQGSWSDLVDEIRAGAFASSADSVEHLDRLFFIRVDGDEIEAARSPSDVLALEMVPEGRWYAITADAPHDARAHVGNHENGCRSEAGICPQCFVDVRGRLDASHEILSLARKDLAEEA